MRQAIEVTPFAASNVRGARFRVRCAAKTIWVSKKPDATSYSQEIIDAAKELVNKLEWNGHWHGGTIKDGTHVFVLADDDSFLV